MSVSVRNKKGGFGMAKIENVEELDVLKKAQMGLSKSL